MTNNLPAVPEDLTPLAMAAFLAGYWEPAASAYRRDLRCFWAWCPVVIHAGLLRPKFRRFLT